MGLGREDRHISSVLVANRGEIAVRVIRACHELGMEAIGIYGEGDEYGLHVTLANRAFRIPEGNGMPYLRGDAIIQLARDAGADAIHPGYGFLAENGDFAKSVTEAGFIFIGPMPETIRQMGDKVRARQIAADAGIAAVPGTSAPVSSVDDAREAAERIGYPLAVKASGGGGGRGFRVAADDTELARAWEGSSGEASRYFNNPDVYLEKYLVQPRHIEVQVFGDTHGTVIALGERDCSVQRRHQKLIEESPSPVVTPELRESLLEASENLARSVEYVGAGTIEYLLDQDDAFYFLEMNTRIQVEHTVTEMVTGIDLVKEQLLVASGKPLSFGLKTLAPRGWALECRVNAEDAGRDFAPAPGTITDYREPAGFGVRVDSAMRVGATINPQYDSLIAKVVTWGRDRSEAISRMERCLREYVIEGVPTTIPFLLNVMADAAFRTDGASTTFVQDRPELLPEPASPTVASEDGVPQREQLVVEVNGQRFDVVMTRSTTGENSGTGPRTRKKPRLSGSRSTGSRDASSGDDVVSPIQGTAIRVDVEEGASVEQGDVIAVVEAMKMENELAAHQAGVIASLNIQVGDSIKVGDIVATIQPD